MVCPHLANAMPLGCAATLSTQPLWPENDSRTAPPSSTSCMLTCMSSDAVSSVLQSVGVDGVGNKVWTVLGTRCGGCA
eukprot:332666-Chlamydomonas_euryale.AAC.5